MRESEAIPKVQYPGFRQPALFEPGLIVVMSSARVGQRIIMAISVARGENSHSR